MVGWQTRLLTRRATRQLVREGQAQKDHRYRPHAISVDHLPTIQERLPRRHPRERPRPYQAISDENRPKDGTVHPFLAVGKEG